jgi:sugar O-acyltransferase (sialic acid O-acetyltransferase NeuD family)
MRTVIYGNGAMAKTVYSYARHSLDVAGFTVDEHQIPSQSNHFCGLPLVAFDRVVERFPPGSHEMLIAVGYVEMNHLRHRKYQEGRALGYSFTSYVHPLFFRHDDVQIADNCIILDFVSIHAGSKIGSSTFISSNVNIGHDCQIGEDNWINSGVSIAGGCSVGSGCFFGVNAATGHRIAVGAKNFVGAQTLLTRDTAEGQVHVSESGKLFPLNSDAFLRFSRAAR